MKNRSQLISALILSLCLFIFITRLPPSAKAQQPVVPQPQPSRSLQTDSKQVLPLDPELLTKIDPRLLRQLLQTNETLTPIIVKLKAKPNLMAAKQLTNPLARRSQLVSSLQHTAQSSQQNVQAILGAAKRQADATELHSLWIINAVAAKTTLPIVLTLAQLEEVETIKLDETITLSPITFNETPHTDISELIWGIPHIEVDAVWQSFNIDGKGIVVANMDTGVDYLHPDLHQQYRGYAGQGLPAQHAGNWFDATTSASLYPIDGMGHGTHTMGTIVAANGIGVAPAAQWIAVRIFNNDGGASESWIHAAFEWIMAPNGDPALAPDIVNNSWGNNTTTNTSFEEDISMLLEAGIIPIFSAGNNGPNSNTVASPGSYQNSFAVGAVGQNNQIASFSSRGPSPWGKIKPEVVAPGIGIVSTIPGGAYGSSNGTSMAAPHVSGLVALILQANSTLTYTQITDILINTATPLGNTTPNNNTGWGLVNAYTAIQTTLNAGQLIGTVSNRNNNQPIANATITMFPHKNGRLSTTNTNNQGQYQRGLIAGLYNVTVNAFGFNTQTIFNTEIITGSVITTNFALLPLPTGTLSGKITDSTNGLPLEATITVNQTPISTSSHLSDGNYHLNLPTGNYTITIASSGHKIKHVPNVAVIANETTLKNITLDSAPTILLVDTGPWYRGSQIFYYQQALTNLDYYYDTYSITAPPIDAEVFSSTLRLYDIVIWSSPYDSPAYVGAGAVLRDYLQLGGKLLISGQNIAFWDAGGSLFIYDYYYYKLKARYLDSNYRSNTIMPIQNELFSELTLGISGGDGSNSQNTPDAITLLDSDHASKVLEYSDGTNAGQRVGHCLSYQAINIPFGIEAINQQTSRTEFLKRSLDWFQAGPLQQGIEVIPQIETQVGSSNSTVAHTMRVRNNAETGNPVEYKFTIGNYKWPINFPYQSITLEPCEMAWLTFTVQIPENTTWDVQDTITISVYSALNPTLQQIITRTTKTPAPVLLVDDDRWYNFEAEWLTALANNGITPDYWSVQGDNKMGTVPLDVLKQYPMVVWFNAYDWYNPLTNAEEATLAEYLDGGGRLILSSQEYLYALPNHAPSNFAHNYFGVMAYTEFFSATKVSGASGSVIGSDLGPYKLTFPANYQNWTDVLVITDSARAATINQNKRINGVTYKGTTTETWHTAFFAYGLELLAEKDQTELMRRVLGWLSWLGSSTVKPIQKTAGSGDTITYIAVLHNNGLTDINTATFTATFPSFLSLIPESVSGGAVANQGNVTWVGSLPKNHTTSLTYSVIVNPDVPYGTIAEQTNWISYQDHNIIFDKITTVTLNTPNWLSSTFTVTPTRAAVDDILTYTLHLTNSGNIDAPWVTVNGIISPHLQLLPITITQITGTVGTTGTIGTGGTIGTEPIDTFIPINMIEMGENSFKWYTAVRKNESISLTFQVQVISIPVPFTFTQVLTGDDGVDFNLHWSTKAWIQPYQTYIPVILKESS